MNNLYNQADVEDILKRIEHLQSTSDRQWGKMNPAQMLAHVNALLETTLGKNPQKRLFIGKILGGFFKRSYFKS